MDDYKKQLQKLVENTSEEPDYKYKNEFQKKKLGLDYDLKEMCANCIYNHIVNKKLEWNVECTPLQKEDKEYKIETEDDYINQVKENVYLFSKHELNLELRDFQQEVLFCNSKRRVLRLPRRQGKTVAIAIAVQHYVLNNNKKKVLILAPSESNVLDIFKQLNDFINESILLKSLAIPQKGNRYYKSSPDYEARFLNGVTVLGKSTGNPDQARGKSADLMVMDETQFISKEALESVIPILGTNKDTKLIASSTPWDKDGYFYQLTVTPFVNEFHYRFQDLEIYDPKLDKEYQETLPSKEAYIRDVLAEFTTTDRNVFPIRIIEPAIQDYPFDNIELGVTAGTYTIGVDWNESTSGVHIVVLKQLQGENKIKLSNLIIVSPSNFTQLKAIDTLISLNKIYNPRYITTDVGFGNTQHQFLFKYAEEHPESGLKQRLVPVDFNGSFDINLSNGQILKQKTKPFMVSILSRYLEEQKIILPKSLDSKGKLIDQMKKYEIVGISEGNVPKYSKGNVHTLEQFMLQLMFMWKLTPDGQKVQLQNEPIKMANNAAVAKVGKNYSEIKKNIRSKKQFKRRSYINEIQKRGR